MSPLFGVGFWDVPSDVAPVDSGPYARHNGFTYTECLSELFVVPRSVMVDHEHIGIGEVCAHGPVGVPIESVVDGCVVSQMSGIETPWIAPDRMADIHSLRPRAENQSGRKNMNTFGPSRNVHLPVSAGCAERPQGTFITECPVFEAFHDSVEYGWGLTSFSSHEFMISQGDV